jgi:hypothetical protein
MSSLRYYQSTVSHGRTNQHKKQQHPASIQHQAGEQWFDNHTTGTVDFFTGNGNATHAHISGARIWWWAKWIASVSV